MARRKKKKKMSKYGSMRENVRRNAKESREAQSGGGTKFNLPSGTEMYSEQPGRTTIRIIPYVVTDGKHPDRPAAKKGQLWYKRPYWVHGGVGVDNAPRICLKSFGKPCPICEERARLMRDRDTDRDLVEELRPRYRVLYNVMLPKSRKHDPDEIYLWDISYFNFQRLLDEEIEEGEEEWAGFADLEGGFDLRVRFSEASFAGNKFAEASRIDFVERDDLDEELVEKAINLDNVLTELSYKKLEALFMETGPVDEDDDEEEDYDDDDEDMDDEEVEDMDDEDDDDDDEDVDDEEEEAPPPPKKKTAKKKTAKPKRGKKSKCPHGYTFGEDCDEYDECEDCDLWDDCFEAGEEID